MSSLSDQRLEEIALGQWKGPTEAFAIAWPKMLPRLRAAEEASSKITQSVFSKSSGYEFTNPNSGSEREWWEAIDYAGYDNLMFPHIAAIRAEADKICAEHVSSQMRAEAKFKAAAKERYVAAGGTEEDFSKAFPEIWRQHLESKALSDHEVAARAASASFYRSNL